MYFKVVVLNHRDKVTFTLHKSLPEYKQHRCCYTNLFGYQSKLVIMDIRCKSVSFTETEVTIVQPKIPTLSLGL
jgi:hypothetical protein